MKYILKELGMESDLIETKELENNEYVGLFKIKRINLKILFREIN